MIVAVAKLSLGKTNTTLAFIEAGSEQFRSVISNWRYKYPMGNFAVARGMKILASLIEKEKKKKTLKLHLNSMTAVAYP